MAVAVAVVAFWTLPTLLSAPTESLDSSWQVGLHLALLHHLQFGKDIVFTLGPLGFLSTPLFIDPVLWTISFFFALFVHFLMLLTMILFFKRAVDGYGYLLLALAALLFACPVTGIDYKILLAVVTMFYLLFTGAISGKRALPVIGFAAALIAVASLIKFTAMFMGTALILVVSAVLLKRKEYSRLCFLYAAFLLPLLFLWKIAGQEWTNWPAYLLHSIEISSGYSTAMGYEGNNWHIWLALFAIAVMIFFSSKAARKGDFHPLLLLALASGYLLISFKHGFVRQDKGHVALFFGNALVLLALLSPLMRRTSGSWGSAMIFVCLFCLAGGVYDRYHMAILGPNLHDRVCGLRSSLSLLADASQRAAFSAQSTDRIRRSFPLSSENLKLLLDKRVDVFPWDISLAYAYGLCWHPRPVFQSYSAYTEDLDLLNARHFGGARSPEMLLFSFKSIDSRYPIFDEPATFRAILLNYRLIAKAGHFLILERKEGPEGQEESKCSPPQHVRLGQPLAVPRVKGCLTFARVSLKYNLIGRLIGLFYRPSQTYVRFREADEKWYSHPYRFVSGQAGNGIFLSYHVRNLSGLAGLFSHRGDGGVPIDEMTIEADRNWQYRGPIEVRFFFVPMPSP